MTRKAKYTTQDKVRWICEASDKRKAEEILIMEMQGRSSVCDCFIVMSAPSVVRVKAIADLIEETLEKKGIAANHKEGLEEGLWVLLDYGDVLVHIFHERTRRFYNLESLWGDAPAKHFLKAVP